MAIRPLPPKRGKVTNYPSIQVMSPSGGLNTLISDTLIKDTEASDLNNIMFVESGAPAKTTGATAWGTGLTTSSRGLGAYQPSGGTAKLLTVDGTALKYSTAIGDVWQTISGATFTTGKDVSFTMAKNNIYIWNGFDAGAQYDGTTLSRPGTMPSAAFSIYYQGVHIAAGTPTQQSRIYVSASTDASKFTTSTVDSGGSLYPNSSARVPGSTTYNAAPSTGTDAGFFDVTPDDGQVITGLAKFKDVLIVFKTNSIFQVSFDATGKPTVTPILNYLGAVSHRTIDNVDNDIFYLSRLGWMSLGNEPQYFTIIRTNELSARIHPLVDTISPANLGRACAIYTPYKFYSSFPSGGSTTNNLTVTMDRRWGAWSKLSFVHANAFTTFVDSNNTQHLLYAADDEAKVYELDLSYSANGTAYEGYWTSKAFDADAPDLYKRWVDVTLLFRQITGTINVTIYADNNTVVYSHSIPSGAVDGGIGQAVFGGELAGGNVSTATTSSDTVSTTNVPYRIRVNTTSRTLKIKVSNSNNNETFTLLGLHLTYRPYSHFKFPSSLKIQ